MKKWTTQTEQRLTEYLEERAVREGFAGEDAAELKDDLRRHIHEEAEKLDGEVIGVFAIADKLKLTSVEAVKEMRDMGLRVTMLTGDHASTAAFAIFQRQAVVIS